MPGTRKSWSAALGTILTCWICSRGIEARAVAETAAKPSVTFRQSVLTLPTYPWGPEDRNPHFPGIPDGVSGSRLIYPYTLMDAALGAKEDRTFRTLELENEYLKVVVVPELGGHVHSVLDKTTGKQMFYENKVVKPALIALRGAWISGGIEFNNGPQGHTVTAVSPVSARLVDYPDGSKGIAIGDVERVMRTQWLAVVRLHPGRKYLHERFRIYNPEATLATYYFWNCTAVPNTDGMRFIYPMKLGQDHDGLSFYEWPVDKGLDRSWSKNYVTWSSIFAYESDQDFFGSYDHDEDRGVVATADHHLVPGKKAWTWGRDQRGVRAMASLTDDGTWYNEVQTGPLATQADYGLLHPHMTVEWEEWWYPIQGIKDFDFANRDVAVSLEENDSGRAVTLRMIGTGQRSKIAVSLKESGGASHVLNASLHPDRPTELSVPVGSQPPYAIEITAPGEKLASFSFPLSLPKRTPPDLERRKNPERSAFDLWKKGEDAKKEGDRKGARDRFLLALESDARFAPALEAVGEIELELGLYEEARRHLERALEIHGDLGRARAWLAETFLRLGDDARAIDEATKATRYPEVSSFAFALLGKAYVRSVDLRRAHGALQTAVARDQENLVARNTLAIVLWKLGQRDTAETVVEQTRSRDPNDRVAVTWKAVMTGTALRPEIDLNPQVALDLACYYWGLNLRTEALAVLREGLTPQPPISWGVPEVDVVHKSGKAYPMLLYFAALLEQEVGDASRVSALLRRAGEAPPDHVFPDRWEEERVLRQVAELAPSDWRIPHALGNYLQARHRRGEAVLSWKRALELGSTYAVTHRNLGVVAWRIDRDRAAAQAQFEAAVQQDPEDPIHHRNLAQLLMENGEDAQARLVLETAAALPRQRSDVLVLLARCLHRLGEDEEAVALMAGKDFKVWEGGSDSYEIHAAAHMALGKKAFGAQDHRKALREFEVALMYPENLGYGRPADAQEAEMYYWIGLAKESLGDSAGAREAFARAAKEIDHGSAENRALAEKAKSKL